MSLMRSLLLLLLASLLSGCIDVETVVYVRADGSGRVEERMLLGAELSALGAQMQMMQGAQGQGEPSGQPQESGFPYDRKQLEERAGKMGPGVRLASVEPLQDGARQGYRAVFAFDDINKLQLDENPPSPAIGGPENEGNKETKPSLMTFQFKPGEPAELIVRNAMKPTADKGGGDAQDATAGGQGAGEGAMMNAGAQQMPEDPQAMAMMQQMFREMRIALRVEVEGEVVESNALFREGSRITLVEMDFGKLMGDPKKLNDLMMKNPQTMEEMKTLLEGVAGVKVDPQPEVHVRFSGVVVRRAELPAAGAVTAAAAKPAARRAQRVEVTDARGMTMQGTLVDEPPQLLRLRKPEAEGGAVVELPLSSLRQVRLSGPGL